MAIDPSILQKFSVQSNAPALQMFQNALTAEKSREAQDVATAQGRETLTKQEQANRVRSLAEFGASISGDIQRGDIQAIRTAAEARRSSLQQQGLPTAETDKILGLINDPAVSDENKVAQLGQFIKTANQLGVQLGVLAPTGGAGGGGQASAGGAGGGGKASAVTKILGSGASIQGLPNGDVVVKNPLGDVVTGQARLDVLREAREQEQQEAVVKSELAIETAGKTERIKLKQKRASEVTKELSQRNRDAARSSRTLNKALTLAKQASQGLTGSAKLQLSRLLPGIDSTDEAALDATLKELALEQLQAFKGPTTDFEFGVTQSIAGSLGQSQEANVARIKSLARAQWFNKREFDQYEDHINRGGDPDAFRFNFGEPIKTKKGVFTLQDIQDTAVQRNMTIEETIKRLNQ